MVVDVFLQFFVAVRHNSTTSLAEEDEREHERIINVGAKVDVEEKIVRLDSHTDAISKIKRQRLVMLQRAAAQAEMKEKERQRRRSREIEIVNQIWYHPEFDKRLTKIARDYIGRWCLGSFLFDFLACAPVLFYELFHGFQTDYDEKWIQISSGWYRTYLAFKLFKLFMLSRISGLLDYLSEILKNQIFVRQKVTIENTMAYVRSIFEFGIMIHLFSCLWIFIGALNDEWMEN